MNKSAIAVLFLCTGCQTVNTQSSHIDETIMPLDYQVKEEQFYVDNTPVPSGCFAQLSTELNGDDVQAAVFLTRTAWRGCIDANVTFTEGVATHYRIIDNPATNHYTLKVCQSVDGSMRNYCDTIKIQFEQWQYLTQEQSQQQEKDVLVIRKRG